MGTPLEPRFGRSAPHIRRRAAGYVDQILRGAKPGDLPIQFPTKFTLRVDLKAAQALGLTVPQSILVQATEVVR